MEEKVTFVVVNFLELYYRIDVIASSSFSFPLKVKSWSENRIIYSSKRIISPKITKKISTIEPS